MNVRMRFVVLVACVALVALATCGPSEAATVGPDDRALVMLSNEQLSQVVGGQATPEEREFAKSIVRENAVAWAWSALVGRVVSVAAGDVSGAAWLCTEATWFGLTVPLAQDIYAVFEHMGWDMGYEVPVFSIETWGYVEEDFCFAEGCACYDSDTGCDFGLKCSFEYGDLWEPEDGSSPGTCRWDLL